MKTLFLGNPGQWRGTEGNLSFGLITQRSVVQIHPPQPLEASALNPDSSIRNCGAFLSSASVTYSFSTSELVTARWAFRGWCHEAYLPCYSSDNCLRQARASPKMSPTSAWLPGNQLPRDVHLGQSASLREHATKPFFARPMQARW